MKVEEGDECHRTDLKDQLFFFIIKSNQTNGRPLPIGGFTSGAMTRMIQDITGVIPREVVILTDQEVVFKIEDQSSIIEVSKARVVSLVRSIYHGR